MSNFRHNLDIAMSFFSNFKENTELGLLAKSRIQLSILSIILTGPLLVHMPLVELFFKEFIPRFSAFLVIVTLWELLVRFITRFILKGADRPNRMKKAIFWLLAFSFSLGIFYWAGYLEEKVSEEFFLGLVVLLGIRGLAQGLSNAGYHYLTYMASMLYLYGVSNFSGAITAAGWQWPFLVTGLSLQSGLHAQFYIESIKQRIRSQFGVNNTLSFKDYSEELSYIRSFVIFSRLHDISLILGPVLICLLQYLGLLPKSYLICLVSLVFMLRSAEASSRFGKDQLKNKVEYLKCCHKIEQFSCCSSLVFLFCVAVAGFVEL